MQGSSQQHLRQVEEKEECFLSYRSKGLWLQEVSSFPHCSANKPVGGSVAFSPDFELESPGKVLKCQCPSQPPDPQN